MSTLRIYLFLAVFGIFSTVYLSPGMAAPSDTASNLHTLRVNERLLTPDDGLFLGNGDLSVSVYQTADRIVWRFGKNDVWDRRLDLSDDPKPAHIDEIAKGIKVEGWKCPPYGGPVEATKGTDNPQRMKELCQGTPPSYLKRPYPCPKPVGELALQLSADQMGLKIFQELKIEKATLRITCEWPSSVRLIIDCFVPPSPNVLVVKWKIENWTKDTKTGNNTPPVWFSLYRWPDPDIRSYAARFFGEYRHDAFRVACDPKVTPLPTPTVRKDEGTFYIEQTFPSDPLFKDGFRYAMTPFSPGLAIESVDMGPTGEARLHLMPKLDCVEGSLAVAVTTSSDPGGALEQLRRIRSMATERPAEILTEWEKINRDKAAEFWSKSRIHIADSLMENFWYEMLHIRRCSTRNDTVPPGLFLPSTVQDYSHWHGDYHTNYNVQEPYWGDYTANHFELGDAYFRAVDFFLPIGRKIARDYYNCRGVFIQLSGYPILAEDDPLGCVPMGRMAYMTGWTANQYWWRYLYSLDKDWLRTTGYPVIKDCALFYTDFMKKGTDGLYHAFPSNQGEDGFTGDAKDYTDRPQIMQHMRYCLRSAIQASQVLETDRSLRTQWQDILEHSAGDDGKPPAQMTAEEKRVMELNPPEFGVGRPYRPQPETISGDPWPSMADSTWYFGPYGWSALQRLRNGEFMADRDFPVFHKLIERWRHPNGMVWGMAIANYGHAGAWTESFGNIAPLQEMMLQSWDGTIRVFPAWPRDVDASFEDLRAQGAFLVSATWKNKAIDAITIKSERGARCRVGKPWQSDIKVLDQKGKVVPVQHEQDSFSFATQIGGIYSIIKADSTVESK